MSILNSELVTQITWYALLLRIFAVCALAISLILALIDEYKNAGIAVIIFIILVGVISIVPTYCSTGQYKYTVEITNDSYYRDLVQSGYSFSRLYPTRNIYEIIGEEITDD